MRNAGFNLGFLILIITVLITQSACSHLPIATAFAGQGHVLTNMSCQNPVLVKLIPKRKQWYIELKGSRYKMSRIGDALRPIMEGRESKSVYVLTPKNVKYSVLQKFADHARGAGVKCVNWGQVYDGYAVQ